MPGNQGQRSGGRPIRRSRFGQQMYEKQTLKGIYGVSEKQLRRYYSEALKSDAETGPEIIRLLESRLDSMVYRAGFAETRKAARQMVTHRMFELNERPVDVPSIRLRKEDVIAVKNNKTEKKPFENMEKRLQNVNIPSWVSLIPKKLAFKVIDKPNDEEAATPVDVRAIVEYFAR